MRDHNHLIYIEALEAFNRYPEAAINNETLFECFKENGIDYTYKQFLASNEGSELRQRFSNLNKSIDTFKLLTSENYKDSDKILKAFEKKFNLLQEKTIVDFENVKTQYKHYLYDKAIQMADKNTIDSLRSALSVMKSISPIKDADKKISEYEDRIEELEQIEQKHLLEKVNRFHLRKKRAMILMCTMVILVFGYFMYLVLFGAGLHISRGDEYYAEENYKEALDEYTKAHGLKGSNEKISNTITKYISTLKIGDIITLGNYDQDLEYGKEPIEWIVIDKKDNKALILSKNAFESMPFGSKDSTWKNSKIRSYLNGSFYRTLFSSSEKSMILQSTIETCNYNYYTNEVTEKFTTKDKVFLLSVDDAMRYSKYSKCIEYYKSFDDSIHTVSCSWMLRNVQLSMYDWVLVMDSNGSCIDSDGNYGRTLFDTKLPIRPAMWIGVE